MSGQVNIQNYYPESKLTEAKRRIHSNPEIEQATLSTFSNSVKQKDLHPKLSPELENFLTYLDIMARQEEKVTGKDLNTAVAGIFNKAPNPENTMWQIRFLNYVHDAEMRKKIPSISSDQEKQKLARIQHRLIPSGPENPWHLTNHKSFGTQSRSFEPSVHTFNEFPETFINIERAHDDYSQVLDRETASQIQKIIKNVFSRKNLLKVPDIKFNEDFFKEERTSKEISTLMNLSPIDLVMSQIFQKSADSKSFLNYISKQNNLGEVIVGSDPNSSLLDLYLYRMGGHISGDTIQPFYDDETGEVEAFEFGFKPENYQGKAGMQKLAIEAYDFFKREFEENKDSFMSYIFEKDYQHAINLESCHKRLMHRIQNSNIGNEENLSFNLSAVINLGDDLAIYSYGDSTVIPVFHQDAYSSSLAFSDLKSIQEQASSKIERLEIGKNKKTKSKTSPYLAKVLPKDELETLILASRDLIKNKRKFTKGKNKKLFRKFFNEIIEPYISDTKTPVKEKSLKLASDLVNYANANQSLSINVLSHKVSDDSDSDIHERVPDFDFDVDPVDSTPSSPWVDPPVNTNNPILTY